MGRLRASGKDEQFPPPSGLSRRSDDYQAQTHRASVLNWPNSRRPAGAPDGDVAGKAGFL